MEREITIFTPTYNRGRTLDRLYESLLRQTCREFVWLVVDDGSTDHTEELVRRWRDEGRIPIRYYKQPNQGKPAAHNYGAELAETELFFCVDSDDYLTDDAVEQILGAWEKRAEGCIGVLAYKMRENGTTITRFSDGGLAQATFRQFTQRGLRGDTALIFETAVLRKHQFPRFEGEKFMPESYLYHLLDREGELLLLRRPLVVCEYLPDGYSTNIAKVLYDNPRGYFAYIEQSLRLSDNVKERFFNTIRYVSMGIARRKPRLIRDAVYPAVALLAYPGGWLLYAIRYRKLRKSDAP